MRHLVLPLGGVLFALATVALIGWSVYEVVGPQKIEHLMRILPH